jgi:hypothetical protein
MEVLAETFGDVVAPPDIEVDVVAEAALLEVAAGRGTRPPQAARITERVLQATSA